MTEANKDAKNTVENNEQEMIGEGAPVSPETDPEARESDQYGKEGDSSK